MAAAATGTTVGAALVAVGNGTVGVGISPDALCVGVIVRVPAMAAASVAIASFGCETSLGAATTSATGTLTSATIDSVALATGTPMADVSVVARED
jgi:hypothetical protein